MAFIFIFVKLYFLLVVEYFDLILFGFIGVIWLNLVVREVIIMYLFKKKIFNFKEK